MNSQFLKDLCNEDSNLEKFCIFSKNNNIDMFYREELFDLPTLLLLKNITAVKFSMKNFYSQDLFQKENSIGLPYDILFSLCSIGNVSNYNLNNIKKTEKRLNALFQNGYNDNNSFLFFEKQRNYFHSLFDKINLIDNIYDDKYSVFLKTSAFLYIHNFDQDVFSKEEKEKYIAIYLNDVKKILFSINIKKKFDNRAIKNLKYPISNIKEFNFENLDSHVKNDYLSILLYYNHFSPSPHIQEKIKEILNSGQTISFEYEEHEKKLLKKIKENYPDIFSLIEKSYLKNNLNNYDKNDILNKKRL